MSKIRVVTVDDHRVVHGGIRQELEGAEDITLVGAALNGVGLLKLVRDSQADVVILDLGMPDFDPVLAVNQLHAMCPAVRVLVLTGREEEHWVRGLVTAGVQGYILKGDDYDLAEGIRAVYAGEPFYSQRVMNKYLVTENTWAHVSDAERTLVKLLEEGYTNDQIAMELCLAEKTVQNKLGILYKKLNVAGKGRNPRTAAIKEARRLGLIESDRSDIHPYKDEEQVERISAPIDQPYPPGCDLPPAPTRSDFQPPFFS
jgi:DNA-binding NarL/FixJ family response regulator